jgi:3-deoxy-7-phosphoheptulonate synthase
MLGPIEDLRIRSLRPLITPALLIEEFPLTVRAIETVSQTREVASKIIKQTDNRLLVIVGPCSIHEPKSALEYGYRLKEMIHKHRNELCIIMRVYFEKPRTIRGWKGLINDPDLDDSFNINQGLRLARQLLLELANEGVPCGTELLDTIIPQFISDLISWAAIGARTTESQVHRELASGLSMPVGFKNGTDGNVQIAIDAIRATRYPHHFLSVTKTGLAAIVSTLGNDMSHVILRGSNTGVNYDTESIHQVCSQLNQFDLPSGVMIDCSHGNSCKDHKKQGAVVRAVATQIAQGSSSILGVMLESHLVAGKQDLIPGQPLVYGKSITDACIGWPETVELLDELANAVKVRNQVMSVGEALC